jgi:hypothetical protein
MLRFIFGMLNFSCLFALLLIPTVYANIVYVYLSPELPAYVNVGLKQARLFNPKTNIFLIANESALNHCRNDLKEQNIIAVAAENLRPSKEHQQFNKTTVLDNKSLGGLWRKSTERFFYIQELIALYGLKSIVHVEADVMLYVDFNDLQPALSRYHGIGAVFDCDRRCIPSVVYIANEKAIAHMNEFIAQNASKGLFDMHIIAEYRNAYSSEYIDNLPLIMPEYLQTHTLMNDIHQGTSRPHAYFNNIESFNSIFDAAAIGQYLGGVTPIHGPIKPGFINETCLFNPSYLMLTWEKDAQGRRVPFATCNGAKYPINNLHIHSKTLDQFRS